MSFPGEPLAPGGGLRFRLGGFAVHVPWNALIGIAIIAWLWFPEFSGARTPLGQAAMAAVFAVLLMVSVLAHELAHAAAARAFDYRVQGITLWAMGGFTTFRTPRSHSPGKEAAIAAAGPAATLAVAALAWAGATGAGPSLTRDLLVALTSANLLVGLFNLLPGSPLDGGAIVKAGVWALTGSPLRGQIVAAWVGRVLAAAIVVSPFLLALALGARPSLPLVAVGLMLGVVLWTGAGAQLRAADALRQVQALQARQLARPVVALPHTATVVDAVALLDRDGYVVVLGESGAPAGVVSPEAARSVPEHLRATTPAMTACATIGPAGSLSASASAAQIVDVVAATGCRYIFLTDPDAAGRPAVAGMIDTREALTADQP